MILHNTTDAPDHFLRRLVAWCCRQFDIPVRSVTEATFRNRSSCTTGRCWSQTGRIVVSLVRPANYRIEEPTDAQRARWNEYRLRQGHLTRKQVAPRTQDMTCTSLVDPVHIVCDFSGGEIGERAEMLAKVEQMNAKQPEVRLLSLIEVTAHEVAHRANYLHGSTTRDRRRNGARRRRGGGSEKQTKAMARKALDTFLANRESLLAEWHREPIIRPTKVKSRAAHKLELVQRRLKNWTRKAKLARTKVDRYRRQVRYYERRVAASKGGCE